MNALDNPIWTALTTRHAHLSEGDELAKRYLPTYTTLAGMQTDSQASFNSLLKATESGHRTVGICSAAAPDIPTFWRCAAQFAVSQMVCNELKECRNLEMHTLTDTDVPEMRDLVILTQPGPFAEKTIEFGTFLAIKEEGRIAAMAGQRMKLPGYHEVTAVCTHPDFQGRGYARSLVYAISKLIAESGDTPILHVRSDNVAAIKSYTSVGFETRREFVFSVLKPAG